MDAKEIILYVCLSCLMVVNVESTGILPPHVLVNEALEVLARKSDALLTALDALRY